VIASLVVIRIIIQFLVQSVGLLILRWRRPDFPRPFRMWLYPIPAIVSISTFIFVLFSRPNFGREIRYAAVIITVGTAIFLYRAWRNRDWPLQPSRVPDISAPQSV
jgi:APA family basic amino acid/polyamine antiporter